MKIFGRIVLALAVLAVVVIALPFLIPAERYRSPIEQAVAKATGRALHIDGALRFTVYPDIGVSAQNVRFANAPGARDAQMAQVDTLIVGVKLLPLLSRRVEIGRLRLEKPVIHLEIAKDGTPNWAFGTEARTPETSPTQSGAGVVGAVSLANLHIEDGMLSYYDARSGRQEIMEDVDADLSMSALDKPLNAHAELTYKGARAKLDVKVDNPGAFLKSADTPISVALSSDKADFTFNGRTGGKGETTGKLALKISSLRQLIGWLSKPLGPGETLGAMTLDADVAVKQGNIAANSLKMTLDGMTITGKLALNSAEKTPALNGALALDRLDLNPYIGSGTPAASQGASGGAPPPSAQGWSEEPIALAVFALANADLSFDLGALKMRKIDIGQSSLGLTLHNGLLTATLKNATLYGGSGKGKLVIDATAKTPTLTSTLDVSGVAIRPLLTALVGVDRIEGTGALSFDISSQGESQRAIVGALSGKGQMLVRDGAISGVDLASVARILQSAMSGQGLGQATGDKAKTDFAEMGGTFTITKGVMHNEDFHLLNPLLRVSGNGDVNLSARSMDFHIEPKAVSSLEGQGGKSDGTGIGIPFRIKGPWSKLSYAPDVENLGKSLIKGLANGDSLGSLLGLTKKKSGSTNTQKTDEQTNTKSDIGKALQGLFGK
jgi:AsmA protein